MKYVHVKCLQRWLKSKLHIKDSGQSISVYWKTLECELCKTGYPNTFYVKDQKFDIVEIDRPTCAYLMLEVLSKDRTMARGIHIIKMENKTNIRLGRGHDSDIRITDISVSRCHALIKLDKGKFYLEDNNSKFGTLVNIRKSFPITGMYNNVSLQVGRTLITVNVKKMRTILPICFSHAKNSETSNDEGISDGEDQLETEHNLPGHTSQNFNANRDSVRPRPNENFEDDNIRIENIDNIPESNPVGGRVDHISFQANDQQ
jgi:predicted component of type VI protein secretion system